MTHPAQSNTYRRYAPGTRIVAAGLALIALTFTPSLACAATCAGDIDGNGVVDGADLAPLLAAWGGRGAADLDGDGIVGGADLAVLLAAWGECPAPTCDGFAALSFSETPVDLTSSGVPMTLFLTGTATTSPMGQDGFISAMLPNGQPIGIELHTGFQKVTVGATIVDFAPFRSPSLIFVNGASMPAPAAMQMFMGDLMSGAPIGAWSPVGKATLAVLALTSTPEWKCNVEAALASGGFADGAGNQSGWCKFTAYSVGTVIAALAAGGCFSLTAGCTAGTVVTIGAMAIPCTTLVGLCGGAGFAGTAAAYEAVLALWGN